MVRCIKNDHLDMKISLPLQLSQNSIPPNSDLRWEDFIEDGCISLSIAENDWQIVEQISTEHYEQIKINFGSRNYYSTQIPIKMPFVWQMLHKTRDVSRHSRW